MRSYLISTKFYALKAIYPGDLNVLSFNILSKNPIKILLVQQEMARGIQRVPKQEGACPSRFPLTVIGTKP